MKIILTLLCVISIFSCEIGNTKNKNAFTAKEVKAQANKYTKKLTTTNNTVIKKLFADSFEKDFKINQSEIISERIKKSYKLIKPFDKCKDIEVVRKTNEDGQYWMDLIIYEFKPGEIDEIKNYIVNDGLKGEIIFGKDWDYILNINNKFLRINSGCTLSKPNWKKLITSFIERLKDEFQVDWKGYSCDCGLPCKPNI